MHVILDPGARHASEVPAEVEAVRCVFRPESVDRARSQAVDVANLVVVERREVADMPVRRDNWRNYIPPDASASATFPVDANG